MKKELIIIGAGVAGLSAGVYARRSGFGVKILEQHAIPGGMCTSWRRKGYLFEGGIHWMTGTSQNAQLGGINELWREVGALDDDVAIRYDEPFKCMDWQGETIYVYRDMQKLERHFNQVSPKDAQVTKRLVADVRSLSNLGMPIMDIKGVKTAHPRKMPIGSMVKMLPALLTMNKLSKLSVDEYVERFDHPALRLMLRNVINFKPSWFA